MTAYEAHLDVASYALGVLDPGDVDRFEEHLVTCDPCAMELEALLPVTQLLSYVDKGAFAKPAPTVDEGVMFDRMANVVAFERRRARFRTVLTGAVAAAVAAIATLALSVGVIGSGLGGGSGNPVAGSATSSPARASAPSNAGSNPATPNGTTYSATDPRSGAKMTVVAESKAWGSQLGITLTKVRGPVTCQLLVIGRDGRTEVAGTWWVMPEGYGTTQHPDPLTLTSSTSMQTGAIDRLDIRAVGSDGANPSTLVSVKL